MWADLCRTASLNLVVPQTLIIPRIPREFVAAARPRFMLFSYQN